MKKYLLALLFYTPVCLMAQQENKHIAEGNQYYEQNDYVQAEQKYRQALEKNPNQEAAAYNLGNALYKQQKTDETLKQYEAIARTTVDPGIRSKAWYNLGNTLMDKKDYQKSVDAYKEALKANPDDMDAKYNLAYALAMLKQQQEQQEKDQQNQEDKKDDQQQDQQNQQDQQDQKNQDQQNQQQDNNEQKNQNKQQQPAEKQFSQEELERILQTLNKDDKEVQNKINQQKTSGVRVKSDKDW